MRWSDWVAKTYKGNDYNLSEARIGYEEYLRKTKSGDTDV